MLRNQKALLFCADTLARGGLNKYGVARFFIFDLIVRWEQKRELYIDEFGETKASNSVVYLNDVYADESKEQFIEPTSVSRRPYTIRPGDYMFLGGRVEGSPAITFSVKDSYPGASKVMAVSITPNLGNTKRIVKVWL